jgi:hypothetical protein
MEQVRPRAALDQAVTGRIALLAILVTGLALPAPSAFAHGNQFVCARVTIGADGLVALELTADHGDNPNIADAAEARQVLREVLRVQVDDALLPLEHVAPLSFAERDRYGEGAPVPAAGEPGPHRLVTASWRARLPERRIVFVTKDRTPLDVVMWDADRPVQVGASRWMLLIAGDRSPEFVTTAAGGGWPVVMGGLLALVGGLALAGGRAVYRRG